MDELHFSNAQRAQALTEALPYIRSYYGKTVVIKYGGNAMVDEGLKGQVMEDIVLLSLVGVRVVLDQRRDEPVRQKAGIRQRIAGNR